MTGSQLEHDTRAVDQAYLLFRRRGSHRYHVARYRPTGSCRGHFVSVLVLRAAERRSLRSLRHQLPDHRFGMEPSSRRLPVRHQHGLHYPTMNTAWLLMIILNPFATRL